MALWLEMRKLFTEWKLEQYTVYRFFWRSLECIFSIESDAHVVRVLHSVIACCFQRVSSSQRLNASVMLGATARSWVHRQPALLLLQEKRFSVGNETVAPGAAFTFTRITTARERAGPHPSSSSRHALLLALLLLRRRRRRHAVACSDRRESGRSVRSPGVRHGASARVGGTSERRHCTCCADRDAAVPATHVAAVATCKCCRVQAGVMIASAAAQERGSERIAKPLAQETIPTSTSVQEIHTN